MLASLVVFVGLVITAMELVDTIHFNRDACHQVIKSESLGSARLVIYKNGYGATVSDSCLAELERPIGFGLKWTKPIGYGGDQCFFELTRIDNHHIKCVSTYYGVEPPQVQSSEIVTDLDSKSDKAM